MTEANDVKDWIELFKSLGFTISSWLIIVGLFIYLVVFHLDKLEYFGSGVLSLFQWTGSGVRKQVIAKDIRSRILKVSKEISKEIDGVLPYDMKIKWVKEIDKDTFVEGNQVIIRMNNQKSKTRNIVYALNQYVEKGLLPKTRNYIDSKIIKSSDLVMVRKLLLLCNESGVDHFDEIYLKPVISADSDVKEWIEKILKLDEAGIFVHVLLKEFIEQARKIYPSMPDPCLYAESKEFLRFLYNIANKQPGQEVDLQFIGEYFKVGVIIIAKSETIGKLGYKPYVKRALSNLNKGIKTIYLFADTYSKSEFAHTVAETIGEADIRVKEMKEYKYKRKGFQGRTSNGVCIAIHTTEYENIEDDAV